MKKTLSLLLALSLAVGTLAGCSSKPASVQESTAATENNSSETTAPAAEETSAVLLRSE